ncbi:MAG: hypothetical protein QM727_05530 [Niabella sp.]
MNPEKLEVATALFEGGYSFLKSTNCCHYGKLCSNCSTYMVLAAFSNAQGRIQQGV